MSKKLDVEALPAVNACHPTYTKDVEFLQEPES